MIYTIIFFFFILSIFSISPNRNSLLKKCQTEFIFAVSLCTILVISFMAGTNDSRADFAAYLKFFQNSPYLFSDNFFEFAKSQHTEIGYNYFQALAKTVCNSATVFFILFCFVSILFRYAFYRNFVSLADIGIAFFIFFSHEFLRKDCVQIRNGLASAIVLSSLIFLYRGQRFRFALMVIFASCFQATALVALPLLVARTENSRKYELFLTLFFVFGIVFTVLFPVKNLLFVFEGMGLLPKTVVNYLYWSEYSKSMSLMNPMLLKQVCISLWIFCKKKRLFFDNKIFFLSQIYLVSTVYYLVFRDFEILAGRFGSLFYAVEAPLLLSIIEKSGKNVVVKKLFLLAFYLCFFFLNVLTYQDTLGYHFSFYWGAK